MLGLLLQLVLENLDQHLDLGHGCDREHITQVDSLVDSNEPRPTDGLGDPVRPVSDDQVGTEAPDAIDLDDLIRHERNTEPPIALLGLRGLEERAVGVGGLTAETDEQLRVDAHLLLELTTSLVFERITIAEAPRNVEYHTARLLERTLLLDDADVELPLDLHEWHDDHAATVLADDEAVEAARGHAVVDGDTERRLPRRHHARLHHIRSTSIVSDDLPPSPRTHRD